jgi:hypothetical protein
MMGVGRAVLVMVAAAVIASPASARPPTPPGEEEPPCRSQDPFVTGFHVALSSNGLPLITRSVQVVSSEPRYFVAVNTCTFVSAIPRSFAWSVVQRPNGSNAGLTETKTLTPSLALDRVGDYRVRFTACPGGCTVSAEGKTAHADPASAEITISAVDEIVLPPETDPTLPSELGNDATRATAFSDKSEECLDGKGAASVNPEWVTVRYFSLPTTTSGSREMP